ncbi:MAG: DUF6159 family protein [Thermoplasmata archaeon]|nr:DUF6159 family protein [Thermoplasmata archaeon]
MGRFSRGIELTKLSFRVIRKDKELLIFPLISGLLIMAVAASFLLPVFLMGDITSSQDLDAAFYIFWILFYFVSFFVAIFFNVAIVGCALLRLDGGDPNLKYGFRFAAERIKYILMWALVTATVGLILRALEQKAGFIGRIVIGLVGLAWSIATYFVVPVIAAEKLTPLKAIKRSASILKQSWGEALISNLGIGLIFFLLALVGLLFIFTGIAIGSLTGLLIGIAIAVIYWVFIGILQSAVSAVLMAALYRYATTGKTSEDFPSYVLENPWSI